LPVLTIGSSNDPRKGILKSMEAHPATSEQVTTTVGTFSQWAVADAPMVIALIFALAGAIFVGIYLIRRLRGAHSADKKV
jgi:flagellar biogenesis protein FliO